MCYRLCTRASGLAYGTHAIKKRRISSWYIPSVDVYCVQPGKYIPITDILRKYNSYVASIVALGLCFCMYVTKIADAIQNCVCWRMNKIFDISQYCVLDSAVTKMNHNISGFWIVTFFNQALVLSPSFTKRNRACSREKTSTRKDTTISLMYKST